MRGHGSLEGQKVDTSQRASGKTFCARIQRVVRQAVQMTWFQNDFPVDAH